MTMTAPSSWATIIAGYNEIEANGTPVDSVATDSIQTLNFVGLPAAVNASNGSVDIGPVPVPTNTVGTAGIAGTGGVNGTNGGFGATNGGAGGATDTGTGGTGGDGSTVGGAGGAASSTGTGGTGGIGRLFGGPGANSVAGTAGNGGNASIAPGKVGVGATGTPTPGVLQIFAYVTGPLIFEIGDQGIGMQSVTPTIATTGTTVLPQTNGFDHPIIFLGTHTLSGNVVVQFPTTGQWWIDTSGINLNGHTLQFSNGTTTSGAITPSTTSPYFVMSRGAGVLLVK